MVREMSMDAVQQLKETIGAKVTDPFANGDVIRWTGGGRYTYAAIKTSAGWFTTARYGNTFVEAVYDYESLAEMLAKGDATDIEVATEWMVVR